MLRRQECLIDFNWGMSVLFSYIQFNNCLNLHDINIISEDLFCKIVNILLGSNFRNSNKSFYNATGFDLIDTENKIVMQVTSTVSTEKVKRTFLTLQNMISAQKKMNSLKNKKAVWEEKVKEARERKKNGDDDEIENTDEYSLTSTESRELSNLETQFRDVPILLGYNVKFLFLSYKVENLKKIVVLLRKPILYPQLLLLIQIAISLHSRI